MVEVARDAIAPTPLAKHDLRCPFCGSDAVILDYDNARHVGHDLDDERINTCPIGRVVFTIEDWEMRV